MKVVALISGGKDSIYNQLCCVEYGHEIIALANLHPILKDTHELDSYLYQTVGHDLIHVYAQCLDLPLYRQAITGSSIVQSNSYKTTIGDETEDLYSLLKNVKDSHPEIEGVSVGAILSNYQRIRVEHVCSRLNLTSLAFLWQRNQTKLLNDMIRNHVDAILIKVAAIGLDSSHLGLSLVQVQPHLLKLNQMYNVHICGEGGEYETFTLDCPLFKRKICIDDAKIKIHSNDAFAPVAYLEIKKVSLIEKNLVDIHVSKGGLLKNLDINKVQLLDENEEKIVNSIRTEKNPQEMINNDKVDIVMPVLSNENYFPPSVYVSEFAFVASSITAFNGKHERPSMTVQDEMKIILENASDLLSEQNFKLTDLSCIILYLRDMSDFGKINPIYKSIIGLNNPPTRVCIGNNKIMNPFRIMMDIYGFRNIYRETLHVQSLSHWAPANIGPYSQGVISSRITQTESEDVTQVDHIHIAGMIAMNPQDLQMISDPVIQAVLSLKHVASVLRVLVNNSHEKRGECIATFATSAVCYLAGEKTEFNQLYNLAYKAWNLYTGLSSSEFPVVYVMVSSLPKGAQIEWQITALKQRERNLKSYITTFSSNSGNLSYNVMIYSKGDAFSGHASIQVSSTTSSSLLHFSNLLEVVQICIEKLLDSSPTFSLLRVFFNHSIINDDSKISNYTIMLQSTLMNRFGHRMSISILPVENLIHSNILELYIQ